MENKLDKLFRDKLEQHSIAPSAQAWEKVATRFPKKNNVWVLSWRIAAAVAALGVVGWFTLDFNQTQHTDTATTETNVIQPTLESNEPVAQVKAEPVLVEENKKTASNNQQPVARVIPKQTAHNTTKEIETIERETIIEETQPETLIASVEEVAIPVTIEPETKPQSAKAMVIVFNLAPVEAKQEVEPVKTNTLKRVLEFAKDVKSGDATTYASVRNWKDNLFGSESTTRVEKQNNE